jgi:hypothetical protein
VQKFGCCRSNQNPIRLQTSLPGTDEHEHCTQTSIRRLLIKEI